MVIGEVGEEPVRVFKGGLDGGCGAILDIAQVPCVALVFSLS